MAADANETAGDALCKVMRVVEGLCAPFSIIFVAAGATVIVGVVLVAPVFVVEEEEEVDELCHDFRMACSAAISASR